MKFCDFKKQLSDYIEKMVYEDYKDELMILVREAYGIKDDKELYEAVRSEVKKLSTELSVYKRPTGIEVTREPLPRTGISKISRKYNSITKYLIR